MGDRSIGLEEDGGLQVEEDKWSARSAKRSCAGRYGRGEAHLEATPVDGLLLLLRLCCGARRLAHHQPGELCHFYGVLRVLGGRWLSSRVPEGSVKPSRGFERVVAGLWSEATFDFRTERELESRKRSTRSREPSFSTIDEEPLLTMLCNQNRPRPMTREQVVHCSTSKKRENDNGLVAHLSTPLTRQSSPAMGSIGSKAAGDRALAGEAAFLPPLSRLEGLFARFPATIGVTTAPEDVLGVTAVD